MFKQCPLKYGFCQLEPAIDALTVKIHYCKHYKNYTEKLNFFAEQAGVEDMCITKLLGNLNEIKDEKLQTAIRNNGGGFYNHCLYFAQLSPKGGCEPRGILGEKIRETFGSFQQFKEEISALAIGQFGSGWAFLSADSGGNLYLSGSQNQDNPIILGTDHTPIFNIDVWEHAYYLKYKNNRDAYVKNFFSIVDWNVVQNNYLKAIQN